jgi:stage IV sporulation protein FB
MSPLFDESMLDRGAWRFSLFGVPVRIQIWLWLVLLILAGERDPREILIWVVAAVLALLVHELGHVLALRLYRTNSYVVLKPWGGATYPARDLYGRGPQIAVLLAGPLAGFCLGGLTLAAASYLGAKIVTGWMLFVPAIGVTPDMTLLPGKGLRYLIGGMGGIVSVSLYWGLVNLLPIWPLDGGQIARILLEQKRTSLIVSAAAGAAVALLGVALQNLMMVIVFGLLAGLSAMEAERTGGTRRPYRPREDRWR